MLQEAKQSFLDVGGAFRDQRGLSYSPVRVHAVSAPKDWQSGNHRGKQGYLFRVLMRDGTHIIDGVVWDEKLRQTFITSMKDDKPITLDNVCVKCKEQKYAGRYISRLPVIINIFNDARVALCDQVCPPNWPKTEAIKSYEFVDLYKSPTEALHAFYALDQIQNMPLRNQKSPSVKMPSHYNMLSLQDNPAGSDDSEEAESAWECESDQANGAMNIIRNDLSYGGRRGALYNSIDKSTLKHGTAFEAVFLDLNPPYFLGRGVVHFPPGANEAKFIMLQKEQTKPLGKCSVWKDVHSFLCEESYKIRVTIRQVPPKDFPEWRDKLHASVYNYLGAEKPVISSVASGRRSGVRNTSRSQSQAVKHKCLNCLQEFDRLDNFKRHLLRKKICASKNPGHAVRLKCKWPTCKKHPGYAEESWFQKHCADKHPDFTPQECLLDQTKEESTQALQPEDLECKTLPFRRGLQNGPLHPYTGEEIKSAVNTWPDGQPFEMHYVHKEDVPRKEFTSEGIYMGLNDQGLQFAKYLPSKEAWTEAIDCTETCDVLAVVPLQRLSSYEKRPRHEEGTITVQLEDVERLRELLENTKVAFENKLSELAPLAFFEVYDFFSKIL